MANHRRKIRAADWQPRKFATSYIMPKTAAEACRVRTTVPSFSSNPFHEGIHEVKRSPINSRLARNGVPGINEVNADDGHRRTLRVMQQLAHNVGRIRGDS